MKNILLALITVVIVGGGSYYFFMMSGPEEMPEATPAPVVQTDTEPEEVPPAFEVIPEGEGDDTPKPIETIGSSAAGTAINAHHFGSGDTEVLVVGGIHSAFAPNTVAVAEELIDALEAGDITLPDDVMVTVIPNLNPDANGDANTLAARLNDNDVDLNRNFDCDWEAEGVWRSTPVSGGSAAFSEPEAEALRDYVTGRDIAAAVVYYAADGGVYASNCGGALDTDIAALTNTYASAANYTANDEFDAYAINGDATNWLAKVGVPAIGVLLSDYTTAEWSQNQAGIEAVLSYVVE